MWRGLVSSEKRKAMAPPIFARSLVSSVFIICWLCGNTPLAVGRQNLVHVGGSPKPYDGSKRQLLQEDDSKGKRVDASRFPYAVSIRQANGEHLCSGALISKNWVLTAARCWEIIFELPLVYIGVQDAGFNSTKPWEVRLAERMVPEIGSPYNSTALGLIKLNATVNVKLPRLSSKSANPNEILQLIGFGNTEEGNANLFAGMRLEKHVVQDRNFCEEKWLPSELGKTGFCSLSRDGKSSCIADSGSPMIRPSTVAGGDPSLDPLVGIVTGGGICGFDEEKPETIAIDVHENVDWIVGVIGVVGTLEADESGSSFLLLGLLVGLLGGVLMFLGAYLLKRNWRRIFPRSLPPEPWLLVEDSAKIGWKVEGPGGSPCEPSTFRPEEVGTVLPVVSRSLRATRLCPSRKIIDSGTFGSVEKGQFLDATGFSLDVAVKFARIGNGQEPASVSDTFSAEIECFETIPLHPNIIRCFGGRLGPSRDSALDLNETFIVEELMDMNLRHIITGEKTPWATWTYNIALRIFRDIAAGLEHLHSHNVSHYDLKPENVLVKIVDEVFPLQIKIADFGCSQIKQRTYATAKFAGTMCYMAPEISLSHLVPLVASGKVDVYSLGIVMWEILTGENLKSRAIATGDVVQSVSIESVLGEPEQRWPIPAHHPPELSKLIWSCIEFDSSNRPTTKMVIEGIERLMGAEWITNEVVRQGPIKPASEVAEERQRTGS